MTTLLPSLLLSLLSVLSAAEPTVPDSSASPPGQSGPIQASTVAAALGDQEQKLADAEKTAADFLAEQESRDRRGQAAPNPTAWDLYKKGGVLMYPITFLSIVVVCFALERFWGLQRRKVLPASLVAGLQDIAAATEGHRTRSALQLCQAFPSTLSNVVQEMLLKEDCPNAEIEQAIADAGQREASRLYFHVRWLNLSMSVAPMLGLLGTVQGMIMVFMGAARLAPGISKTEYMAEGIYLKLVCTFAGLVVAIPAAVLSYLFEARIQALMSDVDKVVRDTLRQWRKRPAPPPVAADSSQRIESNDP